MKYLFSVLLSIFCTSYIFSQNSYYATDNSYVFGAKVIDGGGRLNSKICQVLKEGKIIHYSPAELNEYGLKNGQIYVSKKIQIADSSFDVFLERLVKGKTSLYYYCDEKIRTFFLEKEQNQIIELQKENNDKVNFRNNLLDITSDCQNVKSAINLVRYNKYSLSKLITCYNKCELKSFPHLKYGFITGYGFANLFPSSLEEYKNLVKNDLIDLRMPTLGVFIDNPILASIFSFHAELSYSQSKYSFTKQTEDLNFNLHGKINSLSLPLMIRVELSFNKVQPYINAGIIQSFIVKNDYTIYETNINNSIIEINKYDYQDLSKKFQSGLVIGMGVDYKLNLRNYLSLELRFNKLYIPEGSSSFGESGINILTSISF
jgi:hypothetical protein